MVSQILTLTRADAERRQVKLALTSSSLCLVEGGEEAASDIVSNLVVNALQASPPGGTVGILITGDRFPGGRAELCVEDQGPGIPQDLREKVFQPFFTTRPGGTGLGLAIVARRAEEIGGAVECVSPLSADGGARFVVRFKTPGLGAGEERNSKIESRNSLGFEFRFSNFEFRGESKIQNRKSKIQNHLGRGR